MAAKKPVLALAGVPRVNLMPRAETDRRERISLTRTWSLLAVAALVVGVLTIGGAFALKLLADQHLAAEQARTTGLLTELQSYSDVSAAIATQRGLEEFRTSAMGTDTDWTAMLHLVTSAIPAEVTMLEFSLNPAASVLEDPTSGAGYSGLLTFSAASADAQAATVQALRLVPGILAVDAATLYQGGEAGFEFTVTISFDQSVFTGAHTKGSGN
ncbi:hypothetical protein ASD65_00325 [Microbacterium sp. Root61]|uniref:hypothetical protein n=1 Tax=Microbacterium sp. Root61 TaxID=1736570 RepID=UPI0006F900FE|nr:hypothetical protein [Microbacterium sp. Root61]KRA23035.1 hypothetical protein ASD65_00325 [Microbacterium sp. Root61]